MSESKPTLRREQIAGMNIHYIMWSLDYFLDVQQRLRHHIRTGGNHYAIANVEHGGGHDRARAKKRLHHRETEAANVEAGTIQHHERTVLHRSVAGRQENHDRRNERNNQAEQRNQQHAGIMRIRSKRIDDRAWQHQIENNGLHNAVIAIFEQAGTFEQVSGENNQQ